MRENDALSRTISKNVKSGKKGKAIDGDYMGTYAPFGYKKASDNYNQLVPDPDAKIIVQRIFELMSVGITPRQIAEKFDEEHVPYPSKIIGNNHTRIIEEDRGWSPAVIKKIVKNKIYLGMLIMGKTESENYKTKKIVPVPEEEWIIVLDTHEAIIDQETFDKANEYIASRTHARERTYNWLLQGLLVCKDCQSTASVTTYKNKKGKVTHYVRCNKYSISKNVKYCTPHSHNLDTITEMVIAQVREDCKQYINNIDYKGIVEQTDKEMQIWEMSNTNEIKSISRDIELINDKISKLYDDWKSGYLTEIDYKRIFEEYNQTRQLKEKRIKEIEKSDIDQKKILDTNHFIKEFIELKEVTREYIIKLIDKVEIAERKPVPNVNNGKKLPTKKSDIGIYYKINILKNVNLLKEAV